MYRSLPSWERGLKSPFHKEHEFHALVAPFVGAWIEISTYALKEFIPKVAPFVGAWIEIMKWHLKTSLHISRSLRGSVD